MSVRAAEPRDAQLCTEWSISTPHNGFDPSVATYPHLYTLVVEDDIGPLMYLPTHPVLVIESAAVRPGITSRQYIESLLKVKTATEKIARQYGLREIYTSSAYAPMAKTLRRHGYEPVAGALRKRVK
jgi:hypothetical protein